MATNDRATDAINEVIGAISLPGSIIFVRVAVRTSTAVKATRQSLLARTAGLACVAGFACVLAVALLGLIGSTIYAIGAARAGHLFPDVIGALAMISLFAKLAFYMVMELRGRSVLDDGS